MVVDVVLMVDLLSRRTDPGNGPKNDVNSLALESTIFIYEVFTMDISDEDKSLGASCL